MKLSQKTFKVAALAFTSLMSLSAGLAEAAKISDIRIHGNSRIRSETIKNYLAVKVGDSLSEKKESDAVKLLYSSLPLKRVGMSLKSGVLHVSVEELPVVAAKIEFEGNSSLSNGKLRKEIQTKMGSSLDPYKLHKDVLKIKELYAEEGIILIKVDVETYSISKDKAKVVFKIKEAPRTKIRRIVFVGNNNVSTAKLKSSIRTGESKWFKFWDRKSYDPQHVEYDREMLKMTYHSLGYVDFKLISVNPQLSPKKDYYDITYVINEGPKYTISQISVDNQTKEVLDLQKFTSQISPGDVFNVNKLNNIAQEISSHVADKGYASVSVEPRVKNQDFDKNTVEVEFIIKPASKVYVSKINISGNTKTREYVIRRDLPIEEGDLLTRDKIRESIRRLRSSGYFDPKEVNVGVTPSDSQGKVDLDVRVAEGNTTQLAAGLGISSYEGLMLDASISERNFLGTGQLFDIKATRTSKALVFGAGIKEPRFLGYNLILGLDGFYTRSYRYEKLSSERYGGRLTFGYAIGEHITHTPYYSWTHDKVSPKDQVNDQGEVKLFDQEMSGDYTTSAIGHKLTFSNLDGFMFPTSGWKISGLQEVAGLGGNVKYLKHQLSIQKYFTLSKKAKCTLKLSGSGGMIRGFGGEGVKLKDSFSLGAPAMRGFESSGMGPRVDVKGQDADPIGGNNFYLFSSEVSMPFKETDTGVAIFGHAFLDVGAIWGYDLKTSNTSLLDSIKDDSSPNVSIGVGVSVITPLAPIRIDFGIPIKYKDYDKKQGLSFSFAASTSF